MITVDTVTDEQIRALKLERRAVGEIEVVRCCNAALGLPTSDGALGMLDQRTCRERVAAIVENARQCGTLATRYGHSAFTIDADMIRDLREHGSRTVDVLNACDMALAALRGEYGAGYERARKALDFCAALISERAQRDLAAEVKP